MSGANSTNSTNGSGKKELAFIVGGFFPGREGRERMVAPYAIDKELIGDPVFSEFARAACPFMMPGIYPQDPDLAVSTGYRMKETGHQAFKEGDYKLAATKYNYSVQLFQFVLKIFPYVAHEVLLLHNSLSACYYKMKDYEKALASANTCIELDNKEIKGFYRRAEASLGLADVGSSEGKDVTKLYEESLKDFCKCYCVMTMESDKVARVQQFCDAMIIAISLNSTKDLPDFHEFDKDSFCGPLIIHLLNNYTKEKIEKALQFLFFPSPSVEKSGLAFKYPCDVSSLSVCLVYTRGVLTEPILDMLVQCNLQVKQTDVVQLVSALQESELSLFQRLVSICEAQSTTSCESAFSHLLDRSLLSRNRTFATYLISKGVTPTRLSSALAFDMLMELNSAHNEDIIKIANACSPDVRAEFAAKSLAVSNLQLFHEILDTGALHSCYIDISTFICSPLMNEEMKYLNRFLDTGACPNGMVGSTSPMVAIFQGNTLNRETPVPLTRETQVLLVVILIERGASVINLTGAFPDPMSPVHVATKLVLETKIMKLLHLVCEKFDFPSNGRIVDKHNRTPLHIVMITEPTLLSLEILEVLVKYNIDKSIKDDQGKRAEDYTRPQLDEKRRALVSLRPPTNVKDLKHKEVGGAVGGDKGGLPWRYKEYNFDDEDISSDEETGSGRRGGRKKWEMRYLKMAKSGRPPWSCDMSLFPPSTSFEKALATAREQKERGNTLFGDKKYSEALQMYGKSHMTYDWICVNYPRKLSAVKDDIKVLVCNMALGYHRSSVPEASVECCNDAIDIDPTYYKAYYRRAEAYKYIAKERTHQTRRDYNFECYCLAVKDYARAYKYSTAPNEISKRADMFYECMVIALDVDHTKFLPSIHDCDKSQLLTKVVELLVKNREKQNKELSLYLDYLLLKTSRIPNAGLAQSYPCSCATVSLVHVLPNVQIDLYKALLLKGCTVTQDDIVAVIRVLKKSQGQLLKLLLDSFMKDREDIQSSLTSICVQILSTKKIPFISTLIKNGATPPSESILEFSDFFKLDSVLSKYVSNACMPESRTKLFCTVLQSGGTKESIDVLLQSGPVLVQDIDLSAIITSSLLLHHTEILKELHSITPPSDLPVTSSASKALSVLLGSKLPSQLQQAQLADSLIKFGANISGLPQVYSEPLTPVHAATKLALETGHVDLVHTVCTRYTFDGQVKLIDRNTQTPLHYVMRSKHNEKSIKICQYLCDYPIDPQIKDRWGKTAQEYGKKEGDKRLTYLHRAAVLTGRHTPTPEAPETETESAPHVNDNSGTVNVHVATGSSNPPPSLPPQTEGKGRKNKKKKKNKGGNAGSNAGSSDKTTHDSKSVPLVNGTVDNGAVDKGRDAPAAPEESIPQSVTEASDTQQSCPSLRTLLSILNKKGSEYFTLQIDLTDPLEEAGVDQHESSFSGTDAVTVESDYITQEDKISLSNGVASDEVFKIDFDNLPWEVEVTDRVLLFLKDPAYSKILKVSVISRLQELAKGCLSDDKTLSCSAQLYKTSLTGLSCIMWEKAIQFSSRCTDKTKSEDSGHVYSEVIRVWDVIPNKEHLTCLQQIERSHQRGLQSHLCFSLLPSEDMGCSSHSHLPRHFLISKDHNPAHDDSVATVTYVPPARVKEDEYNVVTFYSLTSSVVQSVINGYRPRRDFPFKEWPKEHDIIHLPSNREAILLLGRSGTGKTTCCLYRLWNQFNQYWEQVITNEGDPCHPHRPLPLMNQSPIELRDIVGVEDEGMGGDGVGVAYAEEEEEEDGEEGDDGEGEVVKYEHLHQIFLTKNYVLCSQMKKRFYDMVASCDTYSRHLEYETLPVPLSLKDIDSEAFPLFLTSRQFLLLLDNSLGGKTFFPRNRDGSLSVKICSSDYETEDLGTLLDLDVSDGEEDETNEEDELARVVGIKQVPVWREVTSCYFVNEIWPKICSHCSDKSIDPLLVWIEIKSFIKGSLLAVSKPSGCLSPWEYESIGRKMATNFSGNRTEIYSLFEHYRDYIHRKRNLNLFDENDLINNIYQRLVKSESPELPWSIHHFFIDEVQDFTQSELALILRLSQEPNGLFLTGDTAQSIMKGISFRFRDLRSLFHLAKTQSAAAPSPVRVSVPRVHELLINFRSHSGILRLATSVIELLKEYFPSSFDRLPEDRGMFPGPLPVFIQSCHVTDLALLLRSNKRASSCIEFGAHQVIIVQNEEAKKSLPDVLKGAVVLTVFESKGLEFDDVLLYNFFTDSSITKEWRVVSTYADKTAPPSDSKTKPRPLNFNERFHKSLNSEFKYLYTAITRAKCNLWIYDSSESQRLPMLDYWMRRELIKVVRVGEKEDDDSFLFTATSTNEQWSRQGDYFLKKGLWEAAMKCYRKAGDLFSEKEAEGFYFAQRARGGRSQEAGDFFEKAAWSFLLCDNIKHSLKHVENAAKCLKNAKKYSDAARLFENLGQVEHAKRCYFRAKDLINLSRMREVEGDYSGAVRVFVQANKRLEALEKAKSFETQGFEVEPDVASLQLANTYAKYYLSRQDEILLMRVLQYIPNIVLRVAHLKKGNLFSRAIDEYLKAGHYKDAEKLIVAQEMYDRGVELAIIREDKTMEAKFILMKTVAAIYHKEPVDEELSMKVQGLTKSSIPPIQAKALLLFGMVHTRAHCCRDAVKVYAESCVNNVGAIEAFNQLVLMKKTEVPYTSVVVKCQEAQEFIWILQSNKATPTRSKALQQLIEFYKFSKLEKTYLLSQSQDIWIQSLGKIAKEVDENGMFVFDPAKVHACIVDHFTEYISKWIVDTDTEKQVLSRLASYSFHNRVSEQGYLVSFLHGYPPNLIKEYIQTVDAAIKIQSFNPNKYFRGFFPELLPLKLFSFRVSLCLPLSKINCFQFRRSEAVHNVLIKTMDSFINPKALRQPHVDDLFRAWFCQCLLDSDSPNHFEETIENFAKKEGPANYSKPWLVIDRHGKVVVFHHFFAFWLKACRLIREGQQVLVASKLVYNCFFTVIARRQHLRKTTSVLNYVFPVTVFSSALVGILSVAKPNLGLCLPLYYRYQCQLFDVLNIQGGQQFWLLSACVKLAEDKKNDIRVIDDTIDLLHKMLELLLGVYQPQFDLLKFALSPESNACEDGSFVHCLVCALVLIAVLEIVSPEKQEELFRLLIHVQATLRESVENPETRTPPYIQTVIERIDRVSTVGDLFSLIQFILHSAHFSCHIGKMQAAKTGNMDFKEIQMIPQQAASIVLRPKVLTPTPPPPQPPPSRVETEVKMSPPSQPSDAMSPIQHGPVVSNSGEQASLQVDSQLQEQWMFITQRLEELQQYGSIIEQQLSQLRQVPPHLMTPVHEQQQYFLTQQYYQLVGAQQQYKLQQESIQQQYQLSILNTATQGLNGRGGGGQPVSSNVTMTTGPQDQTSFNPANVTMTTASQRQPVIPPFGPAVPMATPYSGSSPQMGRAHQEKEQEYETDAIFDEEEIEKILGSLMSGDPVQRDKIPPPQGFHTIDDDFRLSVGADPELVDTKYCQVCGVSFLKQPFMDEFDIDEETGSQASSKLYREHIGAQSHIENLQAYKKFTAVKSGPYSLLRLKLEEALVRGRKLITAAEVDALVLQVTSDLRELDEQLEESTNSYNWKEAHGRLVSSLDLLQSLALRLTRTCETVAYVNERLPRRDGRGQGLSMGVAREGEHKGGGGVGGYVDLDDFDIADDFELAHEKFVKTKQRKARI